MWPLKGNTWSIEEENLTSAYATYRHSTVDYTVERMEDGFVGMRRGQCMGGSDGRRGATKLIMQQGGGHEYRKCL